MADRLEDVLASVGRNLVIDASHDGEMGTEIPTVRDHRAHTERRAVVTRRRLLAAAAFVLVLAGAVAAIDPARRAVSGWLRSGRIEVSVDPEAAAPDTLPAFLDAASPVASEEIDDLLGTEPPDVSNSSLGDPSGWWTVPEGGAVATWGDGATSLWLAPTDNPDHWVIGKMVQIADDVIELPELGDGGFAVTWAHVMETPHRRIGASSVVVWSDAALMFRLESNLDIDALVAVAESIAR